MYVGVGVGVLSPHPAAELLRQALQPSTLNPYRSEGGTEPRCANSNQSEQEGSRTVDAQQNSGRPTATAS